MTRLPRFTTLAFACLGSLGLTVHTSRACAQVCIEPLPGMVAWWAGDEDGSDIVGQFDGELLHGALAGVLGQVGGAFWLDGGDDYVAVTYDPALDFTDSDFSFTAWIRIPVDAGGIQFWSIIGTGNPYNNDGRGWAVSIDQRTSPRAWITINNGSGNPCVSTAPIDDGAGGLLDMKDGLVHHVAATFDRHGAGRIYIDGRPLVHSQDDISSKLGGNLGSASLNLGGYGLAAEQTGYNLAGMLDEVMLFDRVLSADEVKAIFEAGSSGVCKGPCNQADQLLALACPASAPWENHGSYLSCVALAAHDIGRAQECELLNRAAQSNVGKEPQ